MRVRAWEGDTVTSQQRLVCKHIRASSLCLSRDSVPLSAWTDGKTKDIINGLHLFLKAKAHDCGKGRYISDSCLWCSSNHNALGQLANQSGLRLSEGGAL